MTPPELLSLLDQLERSEAALLTWGYVDSGFTEDEVKSKVQDLLGLDELETEEAIEELLEREWLIRTRQGRRVLYRTRSAETIRLMARLRQLFPQHLANGSWRYAPSLVSDFRYSLRPRTYPDRAISPSDAAATVGGNRNGIVRQAIVALLDRGDRLQTGPVPGLRRAAHPRRPRRAYVPWHDHRCGHRQWEDACVLPAGARARGAPHRPGTVDESHRGLPEE